MFYRPQDGHGLAHNPFSALVTPRPIGWISTRSITGVDNLAPYSFFNAVAYEPAQVMFASTAAKADRGDTKDSMANIRETEVFCVNIVGYDGRDAMNRSSQALPADCDEFDHAQVEKTECNVIPCPRVATAPAALECALVHIQKLPGEANLVAFGQVVGIHISDDIMRDGKVQPSLYQPLARMGYRDYAKIDTVFQLKRPDD